MSIVRTGSGSKGNYRRVPCFLCFFCLLYLFCFSGSAAAQTLAQVSDTLYNADGTKASGRIVISWDPFTAASGETLDGGTLTYNIAASGVSAGVVNVSLAPNEGASPAGTSYRARYYLANGASYSETWVVPASGPVAISAIRVPTVPTPAATYLTMLNTLTAATQTFTSPDDTNVTLAITSSGSNHAFTMGWTGLLGLARGGTNQSSWTASRCVQVNSAGTALESASAACGSGGGGGGDHNLLSATHLDTVEAAPVLGDLLYGNATPAWQRLAGNTTTAKQFLTQTGTGAVSAAPAWGTIADGDVPDSITLASLTQITTRNYADLQNRSHALTGADHTASGLTAGHVLRATGATTFDFQALQDGDLPGAITRDSEVNVQGTANEITSSGSGVAPILSLAATLDLSGKVLQGTTPLVFEGSGADEFETTVTVTNPTADRTFTLPNADSVAVRPATCSGTDKVSAIGSDGAVTCSADQTGGGANHNFLSATHSDTAAASPTRGDIVTAQGASPAWSRLAKGTQYQVLNAGINEPGWGAVSLDQSTAVSGILGSANGGTGNGFTKFTGPATTEKTFTLPNADATIEVQSNKNAANGYAGLDGSTKLTASQGQEVWALADLSDVAISGPATAQTVRYNGSSWVNAALACADVSNCPSLVASGTAGDGPSKAGLASTAARSDHDHRSIHTLTWYFPGTPGTGVQNLVLTFPEAAVNYSILDMRVTVNTTSASSSTVNIQRCTASCTGTSPTFANIYSSHLTLSANTRTAAKAAAPDQNVSGLAAGDQFKANLVTIGSGLADVTVAMTVKWDTTN